MALELVEKIQLLKGTLLFSDLSDEDLTSIVSMMFELDFPPETEILTEGGLAQNFYLIVSGELEVSKNRGNSSVILQVLTAGDTLGSIEKLSTEAPAIASIKTLSKVSVLGISKIDFIKYLKKHADIAERLYDQAEVLRKENFFRLLTPFKKLPLDPLRKLLKKIETRNVSKNEIIIREGDKVHECFLLVSGKVSIYVKNRGEEAIANLSPGDLFGEMAFLSETNKTRNSTVIADEDSVLYSMSEEAFKNAILGHQETENLVMFLNRNRSRPKKKDTIIISAYEHSDGEKAYIFKDPEKKKYLKVPEEAYDIYQLLDGNRTLHDLTVLFYEQKGAFIPEHISAILFGFYEAGMITGFSRLKKETKSTYMTKLFEKVSQVMELRYTIQNADIFVSKLYNKLAKFIFFKTSLFIISGIILVGLLFYLENAKHIIAFFEGGKGRYLWLLATLPLSYFTVSLHELAHAYTCKHFKREVHGFGVGWYWLGPIAFCDTTDMWLADRRARVVVNLAGCVNDLTIAGIAAMASFFVSNPTIAIILWLYATLTYFSFSFNLNPILEYDGYYALMDFLDMPHLREDAVIWLSTLPQSFKWNLRTKKIVIYWSACLFYLVMNIIIVMLLQKIVIFPLLPYKVSAEYQSILRWCLPIFIMVLAGFSVWNRVKSKK